MKVLLRSQAGTFKFLTIRPAKEGSLYFFLDREVPNSSTRQTRSVGTWAEVQQLTEPRKLSYHLTGRVNYHGFIHDHGVSFFEPLLNPSHENHVLWISIPHLSKLDPFEGQAETSAIIEVSRELRRVTFGIAITPQETEIDGKLIELFPSGYQNLKVVIYRAQDPEAPSDEHFVYIRPPTVYPNQLVPRFEAELAFVKGLGQDDAIVIAGPNGEGDYTLYFAKVMRAPPRVSPKLADPANEFVIVRNDQPHRLTFRIMTPSGRLRATDLTPFLTSIELESEL